MPLLEQWIRALLADFRGVDQARAEVYAHRKHRRDRRDPAPAVDAWASSTAWAS